MGNDSKSVILPIFVFYMNSKYFFLLIILFCLSKNVQAQVSTSSQIDTTIPNVVIYKDARLDILDTRPAALKSITTVAVAPKEVIIPKEKRLEVYNPIQAGKRVVTGSIIQRPGYRVMIYNGPDRVLAMRIKTEFNRKFPAIRSYMSYNVPNFKIKVGDFADKKDAQKFLKPIQAFLPAATLIPDVVTVKNIVIQ